jgi:hypothetical protein
MALPIYQPTGYLPQDIPRLDMSANLRERVAETQGINSSLDRLSQFAFKKADEQAQREGLLYGAENAPTLEQLDAAKAQGKSIQELFAEPGTTFGDAARKVQAAQVRDQLETKTRMEFSKLSAMVDSGSFNLQEVQKEITARIDGYAKTISSVSPEEGLRYRASASAVGSSIYNKAAVNAEKIYTEGIIYTTNELLSQTPIILMDAIKVAQDPVMLKQRWEVEEARVYSIASKVNPAFLQEKMQDLKAAKINTIIDYSMTKDFAPNVTDGLRKMMAGDYGKLDAVMQGVDRNKLIEMYIDRNTKIAGMFNRTYELQAAVNQDKASAIKDRMYRGEIGGEAAYSQIRALGVNLPDAERKAMLTGDNAGANAMMYGQFEALADNQRVGESYFDDLATNQVISWKQANVLKKIVRNDEPEMSRARAFIRNSLGVPDLSSPGFGEEKKTVASLNNQLSLERDRARASGEQFNAFDYAQKLTQQKEAQFIVKKQKDDNEYLSGIFKKNNRTFQEGKTYLREELTRLKFPERDITAIIMQQEAR